MSNPQGQYEKEVVRDAKKFLDNFKVRHKHHLAKRKVIKFYLEFYKPFVCSICGVELTFRRGSKNEAPDNLLTLEHVVPVSAFSVSRRQNKKVRLGQGPANNIDNLALSCFRCNTAKGGEPNA